MNTKKMCVSLVAVTALALGLGSVARAQDSVPKMQVFGGYSFGTNSCFASIGFCFVDPALHGYAASFAYNFNNHIGLEANFSGHNGTSTVDKEPPTSSSMGFFDTENQNIYVYTFGPRLSLPVGKFSLFSHVLVGAVHLNEATNNECIPATSGPDFCSTPPVNGVRTHGNGFAAKFGGGVDWNHRRWGIRILEVDYTHGQVYTSNLSSNSTATQNFDSTGNEFEMSTGVTFNFGGLK